MKMSRSLVSVVLGGCFALGAGLAAHPSGALAANARNPYGNVDRRNDAGNDTGNSETERLNAMQLDPNYRGPAYAPGQPVPPPAPMGQPMYPTVPRGYYGR